MNSIKNLLRRVSKKAAGIATVAVAAIVIPATLFAWGPDRPTYTIEKPADHVTFNSITNNPNIGDERNFVGIRESGTNNLWSDNMTVQKGKEYTVRMYVHNNAAANLNLVAENVTAKFNLPTTTGKSIEVNGFLNSTNASPVEVYDNATFTSSENFNLAYVSGTLKYENNAFGAAGTPLSESIFTSAGAKLGYDKLDGKIPGCFQYAGYVTFKVKPQFAPTNDYSVTKTVRKAGDTEWKKSVAVNPGDTVEYQLAYKNTGESRQNSVTLRDTLPTGITYVDGSTYLKNGTNPTPLKISDNVTKTAGVNVGDYDSQAAAYVKFSAKVSDNDHLPVCGPNTLTNKVKVIVDGTFKEDTADVTVNKKCVTPPAYTCDSLKIDKISRTEFKFTTAYTATNGATLKSIQYVVRNAQGVEIARTTSANYTQTTAGNYTVQAVLTFSVNGQDKVVEDAKCKQPFEVTEKPQTPVYTCDSLTVEKISRTEFKFNVAYTATNGATFKSVSYVVRNAQGAEISRSSNATYTQTTAGNYTVQAYVTVNVNGKDEVVTSDNCKKPIEVKEKPATPVYTCDSLAVEKISRTEFKFATTYTAEGGATLKSITYVVYNASGAEISRSSNATYTQTTAGNYSVKAFVTVSVNGEDKTVTSDNCKKSFTVTPDTEYCPVPGKTNLPKDDKNCYENCPVPGKEMLPKDSADCKETPVPPVTPPELPKTGSSDPFMTVLGLGALVLAGSYYASSRGFLRVFNR